MQPRDAQQRNAEHRQKLRQAVEGTVPTVSVCTPARTRPDQRTHTRRGAEWPAECGVPRTCVEIYKAQASGRLGVTPRCCTRGH